MTVIVLRYSPWWQDIQVHRGHPFDGTIPQLKWLVCLLKSHLLILQKRWYYRGTHASARALA